MGSDPKRVQAVFLAAVELPAADRAAILDCECGPDIELRQRVQALLRAHEEPESFLGRPVADRGANGDQPLSGAKAGGSAEAGSMEGPGSRIGPYKLLELIGEGGMGTVWMAEQREPMRRLVALKLIKASIDSAQVIARFEAERQALALMDHPHIAKVLDAGTTSGVRGQESGVSKPGEASSLTPDSCLLTLGAGRPYFVMELIKGVPITTYCDEQRLTPRQRLELFVPVCQAVQHAHQKGIIHRDLKPSNVLVAAYDGKPVPKVIDFGVAKATGQRLTEHTLVTGFGTLIGTLEYMSPEQAEFNALDIDTRSDIYSLGVLLYELLTGTTPLTKQRLKETALAEVLRTIREEEPPRPSTRLSASKERLVPISAQRQMEPAQLTKLVRGELDWIAMKALEKDRNRRYQTANGFARDIERYLADEPVQAGPPGARYRLGRFLRRHKGKVAAGTGMLILLLAGVVASAWQAVRATRAEQATAEALAAERAARVQVRQALDTLTDDVVQTLFAQQPVLGEAEKAYLRKVLDYYEAFTKQAGDAPETRAWRARGYFTVGLLRKHLGLRQEAEEAYRQSLVAWEALTSDFPEVAAYRYESARSHNALGVLLKEQGNLAEAEGAYVRALAIQEKLAAEFPAVPAYRRDLATSQSNYGNLLRHLGRVAEVEAVHVRAIALQEKLVADFPTVPEYRRDLAATEGNYGNLLRHLGRLAEAEPAYRQAIALQEKLAADFPAIPAYRSDLAENHHMLGNALAQRGKLREAEAAYRQALEYYEKLTADYPGVPAYRSDLAKAQSDWANLLGVQGKAGDAEAMLNRALVLQKKLAAEFPDMPRYRHDLAALDNALGNLLRELGRFAEAESAHRRALTLEEQLAADFPGMAEYRQNLAISAGKLGNVLRDQAELPQAGAAYRHALSVQETLVSACPTVPEYRHNLAASTGNLGNVLYRLGKVPEAEAAYCQALALVKKLAAEFPTVPDYRRDLAANATNLASLLRHQGRLSEAEAANGEALAHCEKLVAEFPTVPSYRVELGGKLLNVGNLLRQQRRPADALSFYDRALSLLEPLQRCEPRDVATRQFFYKTYAGRARALDDLKRYPEASSNWDQALELALPTARLTLRLERGRNWVHTGKAAEAVADAEKLTEDSGTPGSVLYNAACVCSLASALGNHGDHELYSGRALTLLRRARSAGFFKDRRNVDHLKQDDDLAALRPREDFQKFVAELEATAAKP